ncbi:MAG: hypothetical protein KDE19_00255 [Caldilineaceae bacterium]|nr:hypothetical protein [Caldilineaceae bacterium]
MIRSNRSLSHRPVLVLCAYLLLTAVMTWPLVTQLTTAIPGDSFDGWQNYWNQWWIKVALVDRVQNPFATDLLYYPTGVDLYFHTLNPFNGVTTLPIQLSMGLIPAYNAVIFLSWPLAGFGVYLLVYQLLSTKDTSHHRTQEPQHAGSPKKGIMREPLGCAAHNPFPPFIAGLIFTFSPFHMAHLLGHMQVMSLQWIPFYVLYLLRATRQAQAGRSWLRSALMAGLFLTLTGLCDWYFVLYLFFFTGFVLLWQWGILFTQPRTQPKRVAIRRFFNLGLAPTVAGIVMLVLLSPLLVPMIRAATQFDFMVRPTSDLYILSAGVMDFLIPNRLHTLWRPASFGWPGNQIAPVSERTIALGYVPLLLAAGAWFAGGYRKQRTFWMLSALCFFLLALGPRWHLGNITAADIPTPGHAPVSWTPFAVLNELIPFMRISRSVSRYALMVQLSVAVLAGLGLQALLARRLRRMWAPFVSSGLVIFILFEYWVAPFPISPPDTPAFYQMVQTMPAPGAVLNLPMNYDRPGYLLYQTVHQQPLTVAYISRDDPRTLTERIPLLQQFRHLGPDIIDIDPVTVGMTVLSDLGVGLVVQDRYKMPGGREREYTAALADAIFAGQAPLYEDDRLTVQVVEPPADQQPYLLLGALHWGPLTQNAAGTPQRLVAKAGAGLHFVHTTPEMQLRIRYRTLPFVELDLMTHAGTTLVATLPPAPHGATVTFPLSTFGVTGQPSTLAEAPSILLVPTAPDSVWIEQVGFVE